ncbi:MAG: hypothetical protein BECKG1743F_GA0114225_106903 [Candidatus Kentron sp. G]|nr:MAG: hypothetical protein BECKG1743F_GA0114225_106903 [Candidatus Kentron sp. G]
MSTEPRSLPDLGDFCQRTSKLVCSLTEITLFLVRNRLDKGVPYSKMDSGIDYRELNAFIKKKGFYRYLKMKLVHFFLMKKCRPVGLSAEDHAKGCDVLVLHASRKSRKIGRKKKLIARLEQQGLDVSEDIELKAKEISELGCVTGDLAAPSAFRLYEGFANYLNRKHNPKIILTDKNGSLLSPFLKKRPGNSLAPTFHLAHATLNAQSSKFDMTDYNYYCLYGQGSLDYLNSLAHKFGSAEPILGGSYFIDEDYRPFDADPLLPPLILDMGPEMENSPMVRNYEILLAWIGLHPSEKVLVRLHQRSDGKFWRKAAEKHENIEILPPESFKHSILRSSMVFFIYTNAIIDASLFHIPSIMIADADVRDYLQTERFFGQRCRTPREIGHRVDEIRGSYANYREKAARFSHYHIERGPDFLDFITNRIVEMVHAENGCNPSSAP